MWCRQVRALESPGREMPFYLLGHSGGAQLVHRMLAFMGPPGPVNTVAANAGWGRRAVQPPVIIGVGAGMDG
jgi:hypothetical protein